MASADSIGLSALLTSQRLLDLAGQNIANAQTPGYHRQVANLAVRTSGHEGVGVEITQVRRLIDQTLESAITRNTFLGQTLAVQLDGLRQLETQLNPGQGSVHDLLAQFFTQVEQLAGRPDDITARRTLLNTATVLADQLNSLLTEVQEQFLDLKNQIDASVNRVNELTQRIAELNTAVARNTVQNINANDLADQRDQLINQLAELIDVRVVAQEHGSVNVLGAGVPLVLGDQVLELRSGIDGQNQTFIAAEGINTPLHLTGGALHGLLELRNQSLTSVADGLTKLARTFVQNVDGIHATGLGLAGPFSILYGQRAVTNTNLTFDQAGLSFPPQAGSLFVSVTNLATGARTLTEVAIDPATQNLSDIAAALSGVSNIQAVVDPQSRTLSIVAQPGYAFDFAGRLASAPQSLAITGTSTPQVGGVYRGATNDTITYKVIGSGTIGVTPNLTLEARNAAGAVVGSWNIGQGYEPNSVLAAWQGVAVQLAAGTVNNGDSFTVDVVAEPDTAGLLPALGLNSLFQGDLGNLQVRADLLSHPDRLSSSRSGLPADRANLQRLVELRDSAVFDATNDTFEQFYAKLAADIGSRVQSLEQQQNDQQALGRGLEAQRQSTSGVDTNEELVRLVQYQRSFQVSAKFLSVVNETLADLFQLI